MKNLYLIFALAFLLFAGFGFTDCQSERVKQTLPPQRVKQILPPARTKQILPPSQPDEAIEK